MAGCYLGICASKGLRDDGCIRGPGRSGGAGGSETRRFCDVYQREAGAWDARYCADFGKSVRGAAGAVGHSSREPDDVGGRAPSRQPAPESGGILKLKAWGCFVTVVLWADCKHLKNSNRDEPTHNRQRKETPTGRTRPYMVEFVAIEVSIGGPCELPISSSYGR